MSRLFHSHDVVRYVDPDDPNRWCTARLLSEGPWVPGPGATPVWECVIAAPGTMFPAATDTSTEMLSEDGMTVLAGRRLTSSPAKLIALIGTLIVAGAGIWLINADLVAAGWLVLLGVPIGLTGMRMLTIRDQRRAGQIGGPA